MFNFKFENYLKLIFFISLVSIISAYYIEYVLGHQPCNLCIIERIPYFLSIAILILNHITKKDEKFFILLLIITFVFSLLISSYHFGIEQGYFEESTVCGIKKGLAIITKEELLEELSRKTVSCKDVTFRIFGLSLTSINIILNFFLIILLIKFFANYEKLKFKN